MFDALRNLTGMAGLMKDLPRIKARLEDVRSKLGDLRVSADTGGGVVRATATGKLRVVSIEVDPALMAALADPSNADDRALAQELIVGAVNAALEKAQQRAAEELARAAQELGLPLPPGGLGELL